jgi:hypothetical protein
MISQVAITRAGALQIGEKCVTIPNYEIVSEIGRGANGIVFKAHQKFLNRIEALKIWMRLRLNDD